MRVTWAGRTDRGLVRKANEDAVLDEPPVFAVADGMGGHDHGDVAAAITVDALASAARSAPTRTEVLDAIRRADQAIAEQAEARGASMGTTVTGLLVPSAGNVDQRVVVFNVGDSRCYRFRDGTLTRLTHDHSVVQELLDAGEIDAATAAVHPERNVITRSLGTGGFLEIDWWIDLAQEGDRYLLCSDGLTGELPEQLIAHHLEAPELTGVVDTLVTSALESGGRDNISVVVVDVVEVPKALDGDDTTPREGEGPTAPADPGIGARTT